MSRKRKTNYSYYFSVEGQTEKMYLDWLQDTINHNPLATHTVKINAKVEKDPVSRVKQLTIIGMTKITHIFDRESESPEHTTQFKNTLSKMNDAQKLGKNIKYQLGYSNFTFELWMILHKCDCSAHYTDRKQYLHPLNQAFNVNYQSLKEYKESANFKKILASLTLDDVCSAIKRAESIMSALKSTGAELMEYKGFKYYNENPSLTIEYSIKEILQSCGLFK